MESPAFDIIFAGGDGGTTACVIAGRLTAMDPSLKILVIESGRHSLDVPYHVQPCRFAEHFDQSNATQFFYKSKTSEHVNGRSHVVPCGRSVGGGSAVNAMLYVRGAASDYNNWAALGNRGWSFDELLPFIRKSETFTPIANRPTTHGYSGPIMISAGNPGYKSDIGNQFLKVAKEYDPSRPQVDDNNDFLNANAYSPAYRYIDPMTGRRSDAASAYLYPHVNNPNLTIMTGKRIKRVVVEDGRTTAVEYVTDPISFPRASGEVSTVKSNKLVVVSAGTFGSPIVLERSGIGARTVLEKYNIPVIVDLPGVGENYRDHPGTLRAFYVSEDIETMNDVWNNPGGIAPWLKEWEENGIGKIAHSGSEVLVKVRLSEAQLASAGPALRQRWETFFEQYTDKPMGIIIQISGFRLRQLFPRDRNVVSVLNCILYPESTGSVHITSGEDVASPPDFDSGFLTEEADVEQLVFLYKMSREIIRRLPAYRGEAPAHHPQFPAGSPAGCKDIDVPVSIDAPDIVYSDADDQAIVDFQRDKVMTVFHSLGTCAMKHRDQGGVVDARLNVHGVKCLKVADMSICPTNVGNNTYSTALLIGEKAASIIAEDLGYGV